MLHEIPPPLIEPDHFAEDSSIEEFYCKKNTEDANRQRQEVKALLEPHADQLNLLHLDKIEAEANLKKINKEIYELETKIINLWSPFCNGSDKNELKFDGFNLEMQDILNISIEDNHQVTDWLLKNGYEDVLKFQVHHQTFKSIGRELYKDQHNPIVIPGANYNVFPKIKVKSL